MAQNEMTAWKYVAAAISAGLYAVAIIFFGYVFGEVVPRWAVFLAMMVGVNKVMS
jgi:hypothetical protein